MVVSWDCGFMGFMSWFNDGFIGFVWWFRGGFTGLIWELPFGKRFQWFNDV